MADQPATRNPEDIDLARAFALEDAAATPEPAPDTETETFGAETPPETPAGQPDESPAATAPTPPAADPAEFPAEWRDHPAFQALAEQAERAKKFAPVIDGLERDGLADASAVQKRQQEQAEKTQAEQHFADVRAQVEQALSQQIGQQIDEAVERGDISAEYGDQLKALQVRQAADAEMTRYQSEFTAQRDRQQAALQQYEADAQSLLARPEFQVGGAAIPFDVFDGFARKYPQASLDQVAAHSREVMGRLHDAWLSAYAESEAKKQQAPRPAPRGAGGVPPAPAIDDKSITFGQALAYELAQQR